MATILLVEDNDDHAILAQAALSSSGQTYQVERVASADECLAMLAEASYDAIVLDYSLPKKNGLEILQDIQRIPYDAPVVMITSHGDEQIAVEAMKRGAYDYVSKSDDYLAKLPLVLQKAIEIHEMTREKTELQARIAKSENALRSIFENVEVGIIEIQEDYSISYANPRAKSYLGITHVSQARDIRFLCSGGHSVIKQSLETGESGCCEMNHNGRQLSIAITTTQKAESDAKQLIAVLIDVTEQRKLQQQLTQSERISALGRMASGVAHDFNNILATILGRTEIMLMDPSDEAEVEKGLRIVQSAALAGADTVRRVQEFTRVAKHKEFTKLEVSDIIHDAVSLTEPRWKDQSQRDGIKIDVSIDINNHFPVAGSALDLREALTNIIFNAIDAMPDGGRLSFRTYDEDNNVCISISDTGVGIHPEAIDNIFEPFFTTKDIGHPGLGLSLAYGTIVRHEGEISVNSIYGEGSTFVIRLPAFIEKEQVKKTPAAPSETGKANILVIDDEETIRELLTNILARFNHNVAKAADGMTGIEMFQSGNYDIVFTDLGMPEISGWEVAQKVKAINPNVTIILITGWGVELNEEELKQRKVDSVIAKPFQIKQILDVVSEALG